MITTLEYSNYNYNVSDFCLNCKKILQKTEVESNKFNKLAPDV